MMRKLKATLFFLILFPFGIHAQRRVLTNDTLRVLLENKGPYETLYALGTYKYEDLDFKELYFDKEIKEKLLKLLDPDEYIKYELDSYRKTINERFDNRDSLGYKDLSRLEIRDYIKKRKLGYDSICSNPILYQQYKDSTIDAVVKKEKLELQKNRAKTVPPEEVFLLLSTIKYPELYPALKNLDRDWNDSPLINKSREMDYLYVSLLKMNDPQSQKELDQLITEFIKTKGESNKLIASIYLIYALEDIDTPYSIEKLTELSSLTTLAMFHSDSETPINSYILSSLYDECLRNKIEIKIEGLELYPTEKEINAHSKDIISAARKLIFKKETEQEYWMKNMPFYNKK